MAETRLVKAHCTKCGEDFKIDIGNRTKEEILESLKKQDSFQCPGHHVEITSPIKFWQIDWDSLEETEKLTMEKWMAQRKLTASDIYDTDQLRENFTVDGFGMGMCAAKVKTTGESVVLDYDTAPDGKRYYWKAS